MKLSRNMINNLFLMSVQYIFNEIKPDCLCVKLAVCALIFLYFRRWDFVGRKKETAHSIFVYGARG